MATLVSAWTSLEWMGVFPLPLFGQFFAVLLLFDPQLTGGI